MDRSKEMSALHSRIISLITDLKHCEPKLDYNDFSVENLMRAQTSIQEVSFIPTDCDRWLVSCPVLWLNTIHMGRSGPVRSGSMFRTRAGCLVQKGTSDGLV